MVIGFWMASVPKVESIKAPLQGVLQVFLSNPGSLAEFFGTECKQQFGDGTVEISGTRVRV